MGLVQAKCSRILRGLRGHRWSVLFMAALTFGCTSLHARSSADPEVVQNFDPERYTGLWYEIAHSPNFFQGRCERSTAEYSLNPEGGINVLNKCYRNNELINSITGVARPPNPDAPSKLKVDFGFFRRGDYWIVELDSNYQWAIVSGPKKSSIFILSRTAPMEPSQLNALLDLLKQKGFRIDNLIFDRY